ncbi:feather keratin 1-like [Gymnogyps californianus]|uniref:feather keratin 1-like n=1 Tax=Gymnogyps californianus TaxID=33616 RepID=UPI0021C98ACD|nr:feather keratin 1-like [Gymnogyps californianus]
MAALTETKTQPVPLSRIFCFGGESVGKLLPACSDCAPGAVQEQYKSGPFSSLSHPLLSPPSPWNKVHLRPRDMSCYSQCLPCQPCGPTPLANSCNEPCVRQCQDSTVVIQPSPVVVTLPGPILSSFPQSTAVGSSTSAAVGSILSSEGVPISSGGFGLSGLGSRLCGRRCLPC